MKVVPSMEPGGIEYRPCEVTLASGLVDSYVYVVETESWHRLWGIDPEEDRFKSSLSVDEIVSIRDSPYRIPPQIANEIYGGGEDGMGYFSFQLLLERGAALNCLTGNAIDFLEWPAGVSPSQVIGVNIHSRAPNEVDGAKYRWALFGQ